MIYNEDYRKTISKLKNVDYVFTVPPDFDELEYNPNKESDKYFEFLNEFMDNMSKITDLCTIAITDRKFNGTILSKHSYIIRYMLDNGWNLLSHKIWQKTDKRNLYRLIYSHVMTFFKNKKPKQTHHDTYEYDIFTDKENKFSGYPYGIALGVVIKLVKNFKDIKTVYDPFMGSGTTALACNICGLQCFGSEINKDYYDLIKKRLNQTTLEVY